MKAGLVSKTVVFWWMIVFSGMMVSCVFLHPEVKTWNDDLMKGETPAGIDAAGMKLLKRDDFAIYFIDSKSVRLMPGNKARIQWVFLYAIKERSDIAIRRIYVEYDCNNETMRRLETNFYSVDDKYLGGISNQPTDTKWDYVSPGTVDHSAMLAACDRAR